MPFIIDKRIAPKALKRLELLDDVILFMTEGITYPAISGHPDIFFCDADGSLIASECVPESILRKLEDAGANLVISAGKPANTYPGSALFNAVVTENYLIHRTDITDISIMDICQKMQHINVNQAYTRCNLFVPDERLWLTSDEGILKILKRKGFDALYVDPAPVVLSGFNHGFFGGCCGIFEDKILVNGSMKNLKEEKILREKAEQLQLEIIELHPGSLHDVGGLLLVEPPQRPGYGLAVEGV